MNRRLLLITTLLGIILLALAGFYLYLTGGAEQAERAKEAPVAGVVHVKSIYAVDGESLDRPTGIGAADNGDFYVTLKEAGRVYGFDRSGKPKAKWGAKGIKQGEMLSPLGVAVDRMSDRVYVVDRARLRLIAYNQAGKFQWERPVLNPSGVTMLKNQILATTFGPLVLLDAEGKPVKEVGSRGYDEGQFDYARAAVGMRDGSVVVADTNNARIQRVSLDGAATATASWVRGTPPRFQDDPKTSFGVPAGVTADDDGNVYVLDGFRHKIEVLDTEKGRTIHTFDALEGSGDARFYLPTGIAFLGGNTFAITDTFNDRVQIVRLLLPAENTLVNRNPWLLWMLPLLLLPFLFLAPRRKAYITNEVVADAHAAGQLRLLASVYRRLHVLPEVAETFADIEEEGVRIGEYFEPVGEGAEAQDDPEARLASAAAGSWFGRVVRRTAVIARDEEQGARIRELGAPSVRNWPEIAEEYELR